MTRRLIAFLILGISVAAHAAPLTASGRQCSMPHPAQSRVCRACDVAGPLAREASISAASCCRFQAAVPTTQTPGVVPSAQRAQGASVAVVPASPQLGASIPPGGLGSNLPGPRSTDSPISLHNTLRL